MAEQGEGSKAMNIYIVACFVLAAGALVAYKTTNDKRDELSSEYRMLYQKVTDVQAGLAPNIADYYRKVKNKQIFTVDKEVKDNTHLKLKEIAEALDIKEGADKADRLDVLPIRGELKYKEYYQYGAEVKLKGVTQSEWAAFVRKVMDPLDPQNVLDDYVVCESVEVLRVEQRYNRVDESPEVGGRYVDRSLWNVTIKFVWFASKDEGEET